MLVPDLPEPTTASLLRAGYVVQPVRCIPTTDPELWGVYIQAPQQAGHFELMTGEQVLEHLRLGWTDSVVKHNALMRERGLIGNRAIRPPAVSTVELDSILADLTF